MPIKFLGMTEQLETNRYGKRRINFHVSDIIGFNNFVKGKYNGKKYQITEEGYFESFRLIYDLTYIMDKGLLNGPLGNETQVKTFGKKRFNFSVTGHYRIPTTRGLTLFFQAGYYGSDPHNIYFQRSLLFARGGIGFGLLNYTELDPLKKPILIEE